MTLITFQDGKPIMRDGKVGTEQECCCGDGGGGACCVCGFGGSFDCVLTNESQNLIEATLLALGYINVSVGPGAIPGTTQYNSQCCAFNQGDCETITVFCDDGINQVDLTFCRCTSAAGACVEGKTEQECLDLGGVFHADTNCAADPCNPLP